MTVHGHLVYLSFLGSAESHKSLPVTLAMLHNCPPPSPTSRVTSSDGSLGKMEPFQHFLGEMVSTEQD